MKKEEEKIREMWRSTASTTMGIFSRIQAEMNG